MADIVYTLNGKPYLNITNQCPCACVFCVRGGAEGVGSARSLWHAKDPAWEEIERALEAFDFSRAEEAVYCGFGEPFCAFEHLKRSAQWLRNNYPKLELRINTNGLGDLILGRPAAPALAGLVDCMSISLNAPNAARYHELCRSRYGGAAYDAVLRFAAQCRDIYPKVILSVVDVLTPEEIARCREIAEGMGLPLRVRRKV